MTDDNVEIVYEKYIFIDNYARTKPGNSVGYLYFIRTRMAAKRLVRLSGLTVGHVYLAITGAATNQQTAPVGSVLDETNVPDRAIVHSQLDLLAFQI